MKLVLHENLKDLLEGKNLAQVARELGIPRQRLFDWVSAKKFPSFKSAPELKKIADYFDLSVDEILFERHLDDRYVSSFVFKDEGRNYKLLIKKVG